MDIQASSSKEALRLCADFQRTGRASLFRGQTRDWPTLLPGLFRLTGKLRDKSTAELTKYLEWATAVPQMSPYNGKTEALTAIAQHYGIPTSYLQHLRVRSILLDFCSNSC